MTIPVKSIDKWYEASVLVNQKKKFKKKKEIRKNFRTKIPKVIVIHSFLMC